MSQLENILQHNREFVENKAYDPYKANRYPLKKLLVVTCMDTRLVELLPRALNLKNGDAKVLKTAGALICQPYGSIMRSVLVAVTKLEAQEIMVVGHHDCGMVGLTAETVLEELNERGITDADLTRLSEDGVDVGTWLRGYKDVETGVMESVKMIQNHPLLPKDVLVHGLVIHPETGELTLLHDGRK
ncbi:beta-class carbonic anhydrase [Laceyella sacchari]|jgi:carbonic anhydrase|uniref:carbonic anhydrase n=1 Tax=Laceyella sacchari TaxID=37482 RepID=A0ABY5TZF3_LACSH|nr:carbonic anhydrase [Laceyella sacchari]TCW37640.1 carbonic anhydrase [Laceyella sacchari]UWE02791.1 carbonic anhydrase [Laceyella sacchari]